ncbi:UDP binding domain-containing protein [Clostridium frigidicarnis]
MEQNVVILGITFKENCPDTRNSKVADIIKILNLFGNYVSTLTYDIYK